MKKYYVPFILLWALLVSVTGCSSSHMDTVDVIASTAAESEAERQTIPETTAMAPETTAIALETTAEEIRMGLPEGSDTLTLNSSLELLQQLGLICQIKDSSGTRYRFATEMHRQFFRSQYKGSDCEPSDDDQFRRPARAPKSSDALLDELAGLL